MLEKLKIAVSGYKTYIISITGIITVIVGWLSGEMTFQQFMMSPEFQNLLMWAGLGTVRAALDKK